MYTTCALSLVSMMIIIHQMRHKWQYNHATNHATVYVCAGDRIRGTLFLLRLAYFYKKVSRQSCLQAIDLNCNWSAHALQNNALWFQCCSCAVSCDARFVRTILWTDELLKLVRMIAWQYCVPVLKGGVNVLHRCYSLCGTTQNRFKTSWRLMPLTGLRGDFPQEFR
jgi:uncharacterized membrane protein